MLGEQDNMHPRIDAQLVQFGQSLNPSDKFHEEGKRLAQTVFLKLEELLPKQFSVAEPRFAGSFGKATDVIEPDLDLYVVVNSRRPPFDDVLDAMEDILQKNQDALEIQRGSIKHSEHKPRVSMQFSFQNDMDVDLLPAANMEPAEVLAEIAKDPEKNYYIYNTSLVSVQLTFMKSHDSFTHSLIRLSKFWIKSLSFGDKKFYGASTVMELIGCAAAEEEQKFSERPSMLRALTRVMQMVCDIDSLKLAFEPVSAESRKQTWWQRVPLNELTPSTTTLIPSVVGTKEILRRKCFIVEPANPYYDHLNSRDAALVQKLKKFALEMKRRLTNLTLEGFKRESIKPTVDFVKIFEPQPIQLKKEYPAVLLFPNDFCITYAYPCVPPNFPSMDVRKDGMLVRKETRFVIEALKWNLLSLLHSTLHTESPQPVSFSTIETGVNELIKNSFSISTIPAAAQQDRHNQMNITLSIPYKLNGNMYAVKFSMSWN